MGLQRQAWLSTHCYHHAASKHQPPRLSWHRGWKLLIVSSQGGDGQLPPRKPERSGATSPCTHRAGMLLGLSQVRNDLLGIWILDKGSSTVEAVARGLYYRGPRYSSFSSSFVLFFPFFFFGSGGSWLWPVDLSSLTRDWTWAPCIGNAVLATGPPGSPSSLF